MQSIKAPKPYRMIDEGIPRVFLAGSIEMGKAVDWQTKVEQALGNKNVVVLNPRRDDWDSNWKQEKDNPQFAEQVNWELDALHDADFIVMYFDPATKSPITLLELGLYAWQKPVGNFIVCCPEGFWRKGNVDIVADRCQLTVTTTLDEMIAHLVAKID
jgi:nucleoside 2-deoxyribosyltransferase